MIILLNGPLGIGKSTLAEALMEDIASCVMLDGDYLVAMNPAPEDEQGYLHDIIAMLVAHHHRHGYEHVVINHLWRSPSAIEDLRQRLIAAGVPADVRCFLLTLPLDKHVARVVQRQGARVIDEREFERQTMAEERALLSQASGDALGEPFDVSDQPEVLVAALRRLLAL